MLLWGGYMGKKEQLTEIESQLKTAKRKIRNANIGMVGFFILLFIGSLFPFLWLIAVLILITSLINYASGSRRINELNLEKAKLK